MVCVMKRTSIVLALVLAACSEERAQLELLERQVAETEAQVTSLRAQKQTAEARRKTLQAALPVAESEQALARKQEALTRAAHARLLASLKPRQGLDSETENALRGFELTTAGKDLARVQELAARVIAEGVGCQQEAEGDEGGEGECVSSPVTDECENVPETTALSPKWTCHNVLKHGKDVPPSAFCTADVEYPGDFSGAVDGLPTTRTLIRTAVVIDGRALVADYPPPNFDLFNPPNTDARNICAAATARNECSHACDVQFDRWVDPCRESYDSQEMGCECGDGAGDEGGDEPEEDPAVAAARQQAEAAAERAAEAEKEAEEARQELAFTECNSNCEPPRPEGGEQEQPNPTLAASVEEEVALLEETAPGVYLTEVNRLYHNDDGKVVDIVTLTRVLSDPWLSQGVREMADEESDDDLPVLQALALVAEVEDQRHEKLKGRIQVGGGEHHSTDLQDAWGIIKHPTHGRVFVAVLANGAGLEGYVLDKLNAGGGVTGLDSAVFCAEPKLFPPGHSEAFAAACAKSTPVVADGGTP